METNTFDLLQHPIAGDGGLFVSPSYGQHPDRVIDSWELIYVRTASLHIEENGVEFRVLPGESLILPPHRRHRGLSDHPSKLTFYWIHFTLAEDRLPTPLQLPQYVPTVRPEWMTQLFHQFISDQTAGILTPTAADALLLLMLTETLIPRTDVAVCVKAGSAVVQQSVEYISHRMHLGVTPGTVAEAMSYSTPHLSRLFRQTYGVTLGEFIHRTQVTQARVLLQTSPSPLKQIAAQCGFCDLGYFGRVFRRELGISPGEYRNRFGRVRVNRD